MHTQSQPLVPEQAFLVKLARALHRFGSPSHRTEGALARVAAALDTQAEFLVTPTSIVASFGSGANSHTYLARVDSGESNLAKLDDLQAIFRQVQQRKTSPSEGSEAIEQLLQRPGTHPLWTTILAFGIASATVAFFFDGGWRESLVSAALGLIIGIGATLITRSPRWALVFPSLAGIAAGLLTTLANGVFGDLYPLIPTLAGLIVILPGLTLTIAVSELAHRHLVSGTARLSGAMITFLQLAFGVALGQRLADLAVAPQASSSPSPPSLTIVLAALVATSIALTVLFQARPKDTPVVLVMTSVAFFGARFGTEYLGPYLGALVGAWLVGTLGTLMSRWRNIPSAIPILPALLILVPGSIGFRSLSALLAEDVVSGLSAGFSMMVIAFSLVIGLLFANLTVRQRDYS